MNHPVSPQGPQGGKGRVIVFLAEKQHIGSFQVAVQRVRQHTDHPASGLQASPLGGLIRPHRVAGNQGKPLSGRLLSCPQGKTPVVLHQTPAAHQRNQLPFQKGQVSFCPQAAGTVQPQSSAQLQRIPVTLPGQRNALSGSSLFQVTVQQDPVAEKGQNVLCHFPGIAQGNELPGTQLPVPIKGAMGTDPLGKYPELGRGQRFSVRVSQVASQQQKPPAFHQRNLRLGAGGALISSF